MQKFIWICFFVLFWPLYEYIWSSFPFNLFRFCSFLSHLFVKVTILSLACDSPGSCSSHASWAWASQRPRCPFHAAPSHFCRMPICSVLPSLGAPQLPHFYSPSHMVSARRACLTPCFIQWLEEQVGSLQIPNSFFIQSSAHLSCYSTSEHSTSGAFLQTCPELVFTSDIIDLLLFCHSCGQTHFGSVKSRCYFMTMVGLLTVDMDLSYWLALTYTSNTYFILLGGD